jgi:glycosyltransferase involved in cell wall biosynthesis
MKLSIIIPVYNEEKTIKKALKRITQIRLKNIKKEIIVVDDGSTDKTFIILKQIKKKIKLIHHKKNSGKGSAIITAKKFCTGDLILIQDADLEYSPRDYKKLIKPFSKNNLVVYGSRVLGRNIFYNSRNFISSFRILANFILTKFSNLINNQNLTDAHTGYKVFSKKVFSRINLKEKGFSFCPEVNTKISLLGYKIIEVPISYKGRDYKEGKKISFFDGLHAIFTIIKYRIKS